jgi:hypothetical protein
MLLAPLLYEEGGHNRVSVLPMLHEHNALDRDLIQKYELMEINHNHVPYNLT